MDLTMIFKSDGTKLPATDVSNRSLCCTNKVRLHRRNVNRFLLDKTLGGLQLRSGRYFENKSRNVRLQQNLILSQHLRHYTGCTLRALEHNLQAAYLRIPTYSILFKYSEVRIFSRFQTCKALQFLQRYGECKGKSESQNLPRHVNFVIYSFLIYSVCTLTLPFSEFYNFVSVSAVQSTCRVTFCRPVNSL
jgi:hypothetical protein